MFKYKDYSAVIIALLMSVAFPLQQAAAQEKPKPVLKTDTAKKNGLSPDEEVNVGYIALKRKDLAATIATIPALRFNELSRISADALLQGQVAGVQVVNSSGAPGAGALVSIRGTGTI